MGSWMPGFLAAWWAWLAALAVPLVVLYLLRQKRPNFPISSTLLWAQALADMRASTPFQKLRRNLLLLLQLLILAAVVMALMRPVVQAQASSSTAGVIILDASASMQATDFGGPSRLERAKGEAHRLVDNMRAGDKIMVLVASGGVAQKESSGFREDKAELHGLINRITAPDLGADLSEKIVLAATALKSMGAEGGTGQRKIWLLSDGGAVRLPNNVAGLERMVEFIKIGESSNNVGIVRLAVTPVPKMPKTYQVFVGVFNASQQEREVPVGLAYGRPDKFIDAKRIKVPARSETTTIFQVTQEPGRIFVQLDAKDDDLALDNVAYGLLEAPRKVRVLLVTRGNRMLEDFVKTAAGLPALEVAGQIIDPAAYKPTLPADVMIFDRWAPAELPRCDALVIRPPGKVAGFQVAGTVQNPPLVRWRRDDAVMSHLELAEVRVYGALGLERDPAATELIMSTRGPLLVAKDVGSSRRYLLAFDPLTESDWWSKPSLLIFLQNVVEQTRQRHFIGAPQVLATGQAAQLWDLDEQATVTLPGGGKVTLATHEGAAEYPATDHVGFYDVASGSKQATFAANLLSPTESMIAPQSLEIAGGGNLQEATSVTRVNREIWTWVALAALAILMLEWMVYHRRLA